MTEKHAKELPKAIKEIDDFIREYLYKMDARVPARWFDVKKEIDDIYIKENGKSVYAEK